MRHPGLVSDYTAVVATVPSVIEAQIIVGLLESNDIMAVLGSDDAGGQEPQWQLTNGVRVRVAADDEQRARLVIAEAEAGDS